MGKRTMKVTKLQDLKKEISHIMAESENTEFPLEIVYNRGVEHKQFKITIEEIEEDFFIDPKGRRWEMVKGK